MAIHPSAIISDEAVIGDNVTIGPFSVIKGKVKIGDGCTIDSHVTLGSDHGIVELGKNNSIAPGAVVGGDPQDLKYKKEETKLIIGDNNIIREYVTLNLGTVTGLGETRIGNNNLFMAYVHVAHDCIISDHVTIANSTQLAGHVELEDHVKIGGVCACTQFVKLGRYSYLAGDSTVNKDVLPYAICSGSFAKMRATNKIGMERSGYSKSEISNIHKALKVVLKGNLTVEESIERIEKECETSDGLTHFIDFLKNSKLGVAR